MATSSTCPEKGSWAVYFRYGGRQVHKSLRIPVGSSPKEQADSRKRVDLVVRQG